MLKHTLHPQVNAILGRAGHHSKVLIADGNYPAHNTLGPNAELICLNLMPGLVTQANHGLVCAIRMAFSEGWRAAVRAANHYTATNPRVFDAWLKKEPKIAAKTPANAQRQHTSAWNAKTNSTQSDGRPPHPNNATASSSWLVCFVQALT